MKLIIRHDDYDWRLDPDDYIALHELFIENGLTETAVVQLATDDRLKDFARYEKLIEYMNTAPNWDIQLHGYSHSMYKDMGYDEIVKDLSAAKYWFLKLFLKKPTVWYTPWNQRTENMERAAAAVGMTIDNESNDISKFIREAEAGIFTGHSLYFHWWNNSERRQVPRMLELVKQYETR